MLILDRLGKIYPNGVNALERFSAEIRLGEIVAIIGGSGCGKSTLLRAVARPRSRHVRRGDARRYLDRAPHAKIGIHLSGAKIAALAQRRRQISGLGCRTRRPMSAARKWPVRWCGSVLPTRPMPGARTVRRAGATGGDRTRAGAAAGSAAAGRTVLRARCLHAAGSAGSSARSLGRYAADVGAGYPRCRRGRGAGHRVLVMRPRRAGCSRKSRSIWRGRATANRRTSIISSAAC